jgi:hypothetical protein
VVINTSGIADGAFESLNGDALDRASFFALLRSGHVVKVAGDLVAGLPDWDEAELQVE